jgi:hypothetical protein
VNDQIGESKITEIFQKAQLYEAQAYEVFGAKFDQQFPMPEKPTVKMMQAIGWQFISITIQSVASIVLAALRTADMFFAAAAGSALWLQRTDATVSVIAIEFGIVVFSAIKSEIENAKSELGLRSALKVSVKLFDQHYRMVISIIAGLGVSAGFWFWTPRLSSGSSFLSWALAHSLVAWVSRDILGAMIARFGNVRTWRS